MSDLAARASIGGGESQVSSTAVLRALESAADSSSQAATPLNFAVVPPPRNETADTQRKADDFLTQPPSIGEFTSVGASSGSKRYYTDCARIHESDIRNSLLVEAKRRRVWGAKQIEKMEFFDIEHSECHHYVLESFTETRSTAEATEACAIGAAIETLGADNVRASLSAPTATSVAANYHNPWDFEVLPSGEFTSQTRVMELPSTSSLTPCQVCSSEGVSHCFSCRGFGTDKCGFCRGTGMKAGVAHPAVYTHPMVATFPHADTGRGMSFGSAIVRPPAGTSGRAYALGTPMHFMAKAGLPPPGVGVHDLCNQCRGCGIRECHLCKGQGKKQCATCGGHGTVRQYVKLKVFFSVNRSDYFTPCELPEPMLRTATGEVAACETQNYAMPLKRFPVAAISEVSKRFCAQHLQKSLGTCRVLRQRQTVETIPIAKVHFKISGTKKVGMFFCFGNERLCYIPKKSSNCCVM